MNQYEEDSFSFFPQTGYFELFIFIQNIAIDKALSPDITHGASQTAL